MRTRRNLLILGGAALVFAIDPRPALADDPLGLHFIWDNLLTPEAKETLKGLVSAAVGGLGRAFHIQAGGQIRGAGAVLTYSARQHADGHLVLGATLRDASGIAVVQHQGTAPHHHHADARAHANAAARKAHNWLRQHGA
jgi:hypothetical protein